jgi:glycosyltransferase involved in cell wall biosynthesis
MADADVLVVLPTLGDRLSLLAQTLQSVDAQRATSRLRLVVVLPATATEARSLAEAHGATLVEDPGLGISHAINLGVTAADGEAYYAWIGDDDLFRPGALRLLQDLLEGSRDAVLAFGACDYIDIEGRLLFTNRAGRLARWLLPWGPDLIPHPGSLIRIDAMRRVGLFDEGLKYAMDLDLFLKLRGEGDFVATRTSVSAFRWHVASLTVAGRRKSGAEADLVKRRHLPRALQPLCPLWHTPVNAAARRAAGATSRRAERLAAGAPA